MSNDNVGHSALRQSGRARLSIALAALFGAYIGIALAEDRPPGQLNPVCAAECAERGYDAEFCGRVCWIPTPSQVAPGEFTDWVCMTDCRNRGGKFSDCKQRCRRR